MSEVQWTHQGVVITLRGSQVVAQHDGVNIVKSSLSAVKKDIDKRMNVKASAVKLQLPIVSWRESTWRSSKKIPAGIAHEVITGISVGPSRKGYPDLSLLIDGMPESEYSRDYILPNTPENEALILRLKEAEKALEQLKDEIEERSIGTYLIGTYAEAVKRLQENYRAASKK